MLVALANYLSCVAVRLKKSGRTNLYPNSGALFVDTPPASCIPSRVTAMPPTQCDTPMQEDAWDGEDAIVADADGAAA